MATPTVAFSHEGHYVDYTPVGAVTAGTVVVQGELLGLADNDIAAAAKGALRTDGVWTVPKATTSGSAFTAGQIVYWDATNEVATGTASTHQILGMVETAAGDSAATVRVLRVIQLTP